jgi:hypothetical protein
MQAMREEIIRSLNRDPFVPFTIVMSGGREYEVSKRHLVAVGWSLLRVFLPRSDQSATLKAANVLALRFDAPPTRKKTRLTHHLL